MSVPALPDVIETERLLLRPWRFEDTDDVLGYAADAEWARYLPVPQPYIREHAVEFVARQILSDRVAHPTWAIDLGGTVIGGINIRLQFARRLGSMGWSIARPMWGRSLATEAARAVIDAAFKVHKDLNRIEATADSRNAASQRVMEKVGMKREGVLRQSRILRGEPLDEASFGLLRNEWV